MMQSDSHLLSKTLLTLTFQGYVSFNQTCYVHGGRKKGGSRMGQYSQKMKQKKFSMGRAIYSLVYCPSSLMQGVRLTSRKCSSSAGK